MIDQRTIEKINDAVNILDVIRDFEPHVTKAGHDWKCLCPFHADRNTGSFFISTKKNMCYCFSCEKGGDAVYYLMEGQGMSYLDAIRYLGQKYSIEVEGSEKYRNIPKAKPRDYQLQTVRLPVMELPMSMYVRSASNINNDVLVKWLRTLNWDDSQRARIDDVLRAYRVGTATTKRNEQYTVFWYLDDQGKLRTGKMIRYKYNGKRMKREDGIMNGTDWVHAWLYRSEACPSYDRDKVDWMRTYFGVQLVDRYPDATINIVESEKTAIIMSIAYGAPQLRLWLACGSKGNLNPERLRPLMERKRRIVLYPDRDGVQEWTATANAIGYEHLSVFDDPMTKWWREEDGDKADIADVVLRMIQEHPAKRVETMEERNPCVKTLIEKCNLEVIDK